MKIFYFNSTEYPINDFQQLIDVLYSEIQNKPSAELSSEHLKYFVTWICVYDESDCLAKIALFNNSEIISKEANNLLAGYFDSVNSTESIKLLTEELKTYCRKNNYSSIIGPVNGTTWDNYRFLKPPVNRPFFLDITHPEFYYQLWIDAGWQPIESYISTEGEVELIGNNINLPENIYAEKGIIISSINMEDFENELKSIYDLCLLSFKNNFLYSPISSSDFLNKYKKVKSIVIPEFVLLAKHNNETVGFVFCLPDIFAINKKRLIVKTLAINPAKQYRGLGSFLTKMIYRKSLGRFDFIIHALMHVSNKSAFILAKDHVTVQHYELLKLNV